MLQYQGGEGYLGFSQALFLAGARTVVLSQWKVDDTATALLMQRFYQNLLGQRSGLDRPLPKAAALAEAKQWLCHLDRAEADRLRQELRSLSRGTEELVTTPVVEGVSQDRPYAHPYYWASFILIGEPGDVTGAVPVLAAPTAGPATTEPTVVPPGPRWWLWAVVAGLAMTAAGLFWRRQG
jgi:CHAT domain-containing protein